MVFREISMKELNGFTKLLKMEMSMHRFFLEKLMLSLYLAQNLAVLTI